MSTFKNFNRVESNQSNQSSPVDKVLIWRTCTNQFGIYFNSMIVKGCGNGIRINKNEVKEFRNRFTLTW